ncbi:MAG: hypothetical protein QG656_1164 [Candidatus Hydrogenedentes bacterium]|nr:hypothetical protein [Candidatus Hydrogenedentota bacterium]
MSRLSPVCLAILVACVLYPALPALSAESLPPVSKICIDAETGVIVEEENADIRRPPASMVKMMLLFLTAEGLGRGDWTLDTEITVTKNAESMGGSQLWIKEGDVYTLRQLINAAAVVSANDAAMAVAEGLWGSKEAYLAIANQRAAELGMTNTEFHSVHGLPPRDETPDDLTTARDMATLARQCVYTPPIMEWVGQKEFNFRPNSTCHSTNKLLTMMDECDGLKTGWTRDAGWCLTATARKDHLRLISVLMGCPSKMDRFKISKAILDEGFASLKCFRVVHKGDSLGDPVSVADCDPLRVQLAAAEDIWVTVRASDVERIQVLTEPPCQLASPIRPGTPVGQVRVLLGGEVLGQSALTVPSDINLAQWRLSVADYAKR